ncbi:MAG: bifunctional metallophosphatase/5'-nucleotidase [Clostridia bacterium]|nr:bifunctional metallophosphatase/5'-nucleotidase [Clostridia bacterium]
MFRTLSLLLLLSLVLPFLLSIPVSAADENHATVIFTHDLHSHFLPTPTDHGGEVGGYARLATLIKQQKEKNPNAILVDGGDFSMGSLFQTAYATSATELRLMGEMGFDVTTFGNHEFDYLEEGLSDMLNAAKASGDPLPAIVESNYLPPKAGDKNETEHSQDVRDAFENYGVKNYILLERGDVYFAIFGLMGFDGDACAPNSGMIMTDPVKTAKETVKQATEECKSRYNADPIVVCLSHSGTDNGKGEDYTLAQKVPEIDLIVSAHTHTTLKEAIRVGNTYIVSAGDYGRYLGVVDLVKNSDSTVTLEKYSLIPVDETVKEDPSIAGKVAEFKQAVNDDYLAAYGMTFDQVLANNKIEFEPQSAVGATQHESPLANLYADAYFWAAEQTLGFRPDIALTATGVIRESLPLGNITVSDVFNAASLGVGTEGELIAVYITGEDLWSALEVDASVQPIMPAAQLFFSGIEYSFNTNRMIFNKVDYTRLRLADGTLAEIDDDKLYCVIAGMYAGQMLGSVKEKSFGLLSITPRNAEGKALSADELKDYVIRDENGRPLKEWYAISSYIENMGGEVDEAYATTDGRKVVYSSWNPVKLLRNPNIFTFVALILILLIILLIVLLVRFIIKRVKKRKAKKQIPEEKPEESNEG